MKIKTLQKIGRTLLREIPKEVLACQTVMGKGAGGDKTFPIDKKAEDIIINSLASLGEPLSIISEEAGIIELLGGGRKVLIDPIDGSRNAVAGIPFYCTSIAVADGEKIKDIELTYIINLINSDEFWAEKGKGSFLNGKSISTQKTDAFRLVAYESQSPHRDIPRIIPLLSAAHKSRCLGATALDLAYLSAGAISVFATPALSRSFDFGAGWLLVKEAGGIFTDINGSEIDNMQLGLKRISSILASGNLKLHKKALSLLNF